MNLYAKWHDYGKNKNKIIYSVKLPVLTQWGGVFCSPQAAFLGKTLAAATEQTESVANSLLLAFVSLSDLLLFLIIGKGIGRLFAIIGPYRNQREANVA